MIEYPHIDSVYKRDERGKFIIGEYSQPEFEYLKDYVPWFWTEKIDGTNTRVMWDGTGVDFAGKAANSQMPVKFRNMLAQTFHVNPDWTEHERFKKLKEVFGDTPACLYGEGYGGDIQKVGKLYSDTQKFILFDIRIGRWWLKREDVEEIARKLDILIVPRVGYVTLSSMITNVSERPPEQSSLGNLLAEGFVGIPAVPLLNRAGERVITKIKYKDFK